MGIDENMSLEFTHKRLMRNPIEITGNRASMSNNGENSVLDKKII